MGIIMVSPHRVVVYIKHFTCREQSKNSIKVINDDKDNITLSRALCWEQVQRTASSSGCSIFRGFDKWISLER